MERFCVIANRLKDEAFELRQQIVDFLVEHEKQALIADVLPEDGSLIYTDAKALPANTECAVVLGGDGTILQAAHDLADTGIPLFGINLGTLGFLAETEVNGVKKALEALFLGEYTIEKRMMLSVVVNEEEDRSVCLDALNDVVITRSGFSRLIGVGIYVNGELVNDYRGDGVIISTPTGSTGYNLSAGGPVVTPEAEVMLITPICPHSLNARSIVVSVLDTIEVRIRQSKKTQEEEAIATIDGRASRQLKAQDRIIVRRSDRLTNLIKLRGKSFFDILRTKIGSYEHIKERLE